MAGATPARRCALDLTSEARRRNAHVRDLMRESPAVAALDARDRAFVTRLVTGVTCSSGLLDQVIRSHTKPRTKLESRVRDALRLAVFELLYLSTPDAVAVSQGVELVRSVSRRAAGLANAVLRRVAEEDVERVAEACGRVSNGMEEPGDLALVSGLPEWLIQRLLDSMGAEATRALALVSLEPSPATAAANLARITADDAVELLASQGIEAERLLLPGALELSSMAGLATSGLVDAAAIAPADLGAQLVAVAAAPLPGQSVLEVGQGRGTKSILLESAAIFLGGPARIVGVDSEEFKTQVSDARMEVAGIADFVSSVTLDARELSGAGLPPEVSGEFDVVFVDAPCSGAGTMRRHPEIAWSLDPATLDVESEDSLPRLQLDILRAASARVAPGGALVYATCSPLFEEDAWVVREFLASPEGQGFSLASAASGPAVQALSPEALDTFLACVDAEGLFLSVGEGLACDLHFCARLVRD